MTSLLLDKKMHKLLIEEEGLADRVRIVLKTGIMTTYKTEMEQIRTFGSGLAVMFVIFSSISLYQRD